MSPAARPPRRADEVAAGRGTDLRRLPARRARARTGQARRRGCRSCGDGAANRGSRSGSGYSASLHRLADGPRRRPRHRARGRRACRLRPLLPRLPHRERSQRRAGRALAAQRTPRRTVNAVPVSVALVAGGLAVVNPCGFPLLPAFLSFYLGADEQTLPRAPTRILQGLLVGGLVAAGFLGLFALVGLPVS